MGKSGDTFWDAALDRRSLQRWAKSACAASTSEHRILRKQSIRARQLRTQLDRLIHAADDRLNVPLTDADHLPAPINSDWCWRPDFWRGALAFGGLSSVQNNTTFGEDVTLFHDCSLSENTFRQVRNSGHKSSAPYGLQVEVFQFDGTFLSIVLNLPTRASQNLNRGHIVTVKGSLETENPMGCLVRLNVQHGPNIEKFVQPCDLGLPEFSVAFDLAYSNLNEKAAEKAWIDVIFDRPEMNKITLSDLVLWRSRRADI